MYKITQLNESGIEFWNNIIESSRITLERSKNLTLIPIGLFLFICLILAIMITITVISKFRFNRDASFLFERLSSLLPLLMILGVTAMCIFLQNLGDNEKKETFKIQKESIERLLENADSISVIRVQGEFDIMKILVGQSNKNSDEITTSIQIIFDDSRIAPITVDDTKLKMKVSKPNEAITYQYEYDINTNTIYYLEDPNTIKEN